ncbi:hypothetical protein HY374_00485 [Candidatus Berkelbacteria bacterium]|nr:hypothetical protein [Candidatus Berkelbacteria bacterium]
MTVQALSLTPTARQFLEELPEKSLRAVIVALINHPAIEPLGTKIGDCVTPEAVERIIEQSPLLITEHVHEGGSTFYLSLLAEAQRRSGQRPISLFVLTSVAFLKAGDCSHSNRFPEFGHYLWRWPDLSPDFDLFADRLDELTTTTLFMEQADHGDRLRDARSIIELVDKYHLDEDCRAYARHIADQIEQGSPLIT